MQLQFLRFSRLIADFTGNAWAFVLALLSVLGWLVTGPTFHFSQGWQLVINTGTTIVTFLMVFLIQNAQDEDTRELRATLRSVLDEVRELRAQLEPRPALAAEVGPEVRRGERQ